MGFYDVISKKNLKIQLCFVNIFVILKINVLNTHNSWLKLSFETVKNFNIYSDLWNAPSLVNVT